METILSITCFSSSSTSLCSPSLCSPWVALPAIALGVGLGGLWINQQIYRFFEKAVISRFGRYYQADLLAPKKLPHKKQIIVALPTNGMVLYAMKMAISITVATVAMVAAIAFSTALPLASLFCVSMALGGFIDVCYYTCEQNAKSTFEGSNWVALVVKEEKKRGIDPAKLPFLSNKGWSITFYDYEQKKWVDNFWYP